MKYLIITSYDTWYDYQVNINGITYESNTKIAQKFYNKHWGTSLNQFYEWIKDEYKDYDLIVYIDDADIKIIKGDKDNAII